MNSSSTDLQSAFTAVEFDPFAGGDLLLTAPATEAQQEIWTSVRMGDDANCAYNESQSLWLRGELAIDALQDALQQLVLRHEALRTTFSPDGSHLCILASSTLDLLFLDWSELEPAERDARVAALQRQVVEQPFDLEQGPLFRVQIIRLQPQEHVVIMTAHHIICDGWSWAVLMTDLGNLYSALKQGIAPELEEPERFSDYALMLEQETSSDEAIATEQYWLQQFKDSVPVLEFPTDRLRPPVRTFEAAREDWHLSPALVSNLKQLGTKFGCSFMTTLLASFEVLLYRLTGQEDLVVGIPAAGQAATDRYNLVGHCVNLLPLRSRVEGERSFSAYLQARKSMILDAYDHQQFTFGNLVKQLAIPRDSSRIPLVPITFNIDQGLDADRLHFEGLAVEFPTNPRSFENFELFINAVELHGKLTLECQYNTNLFDAATIRHRMAEFETLLTGITTHPDAAIAKLPILPDAEQQLLTEWNQTQTDYPRDRCIHHLFEAQVAQTPDAIAVVFNNQQLTYRELNRRANQLAHHLQKLGVHSDTLVGICTERSLETIVGLLGILKAGGAYVPLDPSYPQERLAFMVEDTQISILLTQRSQIDTVPNYRGAIVCLDQDGDAIALESADNPSNTTTASHLAYVTFTSGSTGKPKGVSVGHRGCVRLVKETHYANFHTEAVFLQLAPLAFDASTFEIWGSLLNGARLVLFPADKPSLEELEQVIEQHQVTTLWLTAGLFHLIVDERPDALKPLRQLLAGGDVLSVPHVQRFLQANPDCQLINGYGPTEGTTFTCCYPITTAALTSSSIPIGRPIANTQVYLLDRHLQPVPIGAVGELHIGGDGLAREYFNRPDLTAEKFISNPFSPDSTARLYKTGDLARYLPDGNIEFLGRVDNQVKVRGFRIELGEIEAALSQCPGVQKSVVVVREDVPGDKTLAGYVTLADQSSGQSADQALNIQQVSDWQKRWDLLYAEGLQQLADSNRADEKLSDLAILQQLSDREDLKEDAQEWIDQTLSRIRSLQPDRVLEIGCGSGQLLLEIAPECSYYFGTDYADLAIQELRTYLQTLEHPMPQVALDCRDASTFEGIEPASFDTVIIHSVAQYFPDARYLYQVVEQSVRATRPGGVVYVGDVQSYGLLEAYHAGDQLKRSPATMTTATLQGIIENRVRNEDELVVDPEFFYGLQQQLPDIARVEVKFRRGRRRNETTQFHYDVFLHLQPDDTQVAEPEWQNWQEDQLTLETVRQVLATSQPAIYAIQGIPNARIQQEVRIPAILKGSQVATVADLLAALEQLPNGVDPEDLWAIAETLPYTVDLRWSVAAKEGCLEAVFVRKDLEGQMMAIAPTVKSALQTWDTYTNSPARKQPVDQSIIPKLRQFLQERLPDYMIPNTFMVLDSMPLNPSGKVDRKALPAPDMVRLDLASTYVAPRDPVEEQVADIWAQILRLEQIGIHDNFFELGGHSLLGTQIISRLSKAFEVKLPLRTLFEVPTVAGLAKRIETIRWAVQTPQLDTVGNYEEGDL
jgi:amino acid adenylation domain-containing protein